MINTSCKKCWWQEGGKCYNDKLDNQSGRDIPNYPEPLTECKNEFWDKRAALTTVIPDEFLVICSEEKKIF